MHGERDTLHIGKGDFTMKKKTVIGGILGVAIVAVAGILIFTNKDRFLKEDTSGMDFTVSYEGIATKDISSGAAVHDPSIVKDEDTYYIFGSHMVGAASTDLRDWEQFGGGYTKKNSIYGDILTRNEDIFAYSGNRKSAIPTDDKKTHVWAPDVVYNPVMGKWMMYYCTTSTWNASNLCFGVSDAVDGPYEWQSALIYSGFTKKNIEDTNVLDVVDEKWVNDHYYFSGEYNYTQYPNAIDPSIFFDQDERMWMVYGSWSGGIYLLELDPATGQVIFPEADEENQVDPYFGKRLLGGGHKSIEGPYIQYDEATGYYYLFVSYGALTSDGGYQIRVFRSETVDGEYLDMNGKKPQPMDEEHKAFGLKLSGNYNLPSLALPYMATGHNSAFVDDDGKFYVVYHTRFADGTENHSPRVKQAIMNKEGWPCMLPYATDGETVSETGYEKDEVVGRYYMINQGTSISNKIAEPVIVYLTKKGNVFGEGIEGTWEMEEGTYYMNLTYGDVTYSGGFCQMRDEAGTEVMTFSAVGENKSIWGVKY